MRLFCHQDPHLGVEQPYFPLFEGGTWNCFPQSSPIYGEQAVYLLSWMACFGTVGKMGDNPSRSIRRVIFLWSYLSDKHWKFLSKKMGNTPQVLYIILGQLLVVWIQSCPRSLIQHVGFMFGTRTGLPYRRVLLRVITFTSSHRTSLETDFHMVLAASTICIYVKLYWDLCHPITAIHRRDRMTIRYRLRFIHSLCHIFMLCPFMSRCETLSLRCHKMDACNVGIIFLYFSSSISTVDLSKASCLHGQAHSRGR